VSISLFCVGDFLVIPKLDKLLNHNMTLDTTYWIEVHYDVDCIEDLAIEIVVSCW